ncbi:MAG: type II toxin-antitoxin system VapC family toxin [Rhodospirillaceae bacterium]|nr:type II toxin-antitoxin system VapC family toxin [Rhodospirillaceae bacterium]
MKFTVDAGIVVKWYISENCSDEARLLLAHRLERHAPDFLLVEYASTVWKKARRGEVADPQAYLDEIPELGNVINLHADRDMAQRAAGLAVAIDHPVCDCLYLACAEATGSRLITADRKFADKVVGGLPDADVRYIEADGLADEVAIAATAFVTSREKMEELVAAHDFLVATDEHVRFALYDGKTGLKIVSPEDMARILDSPAGRRLEALFDELTEEEYIDLLALGWLGQGNSGTEWQAIFERACAMIV